MIEQFTGHSVVRWVERDQYGGKKAQLNVGRCFKLEEAFVQCM